MLDCERGHWPDTGKTQNRERTGDDLERQKEESWFPVGGAASSLRLLTKCSFYFFNKNIVLFA